jgi:hypothetical protein
MSDIGIYRIYFNAHGDFPLIASIDTGDDTKELKVRTISIVCQSGNRTSSHYRPERQPKFWIQVEGVLEIIDGNAVIYQQFLGD